jgi:hypothetical protein
MINLFSLLKWSAVVIKKVETNMPSPDDDAVKLLSSIKE